MCEVSEPAALARRRCVEYNAGLACLRAAQPVNAFRALSRCASHFAALPRLWLRLAEACAMLRCERAARAAARAPLAVELEKRREPRPTAVHKTDGHSTDSDGDEEARRCDVSDDSDDEQMTQSAAERSSMRRGRVRTHAGLKRKREKNLRRVLGVGYSLSLSPACLSLLWERTRCLRA